MMVREQASSSMPLADEAAWCHSWKRKKEGRWRGRRPTVVGFTRLASGWGRLGVGLGEEEGRQRRRCRSEDDGTGEVQ
jgi:hypothetical protein